MEDQIIPTLQTDRLILRSFTQSDLEPFAEIVSDPEVMRFATYSGETMTRAQAWNWLCLMLGHWHMRGFGIWAVEKKNTNTLIGRIGLQYLDWFEDVELVWMLSRATWGKGFALEGMLAVIKYAFGTLELPRVTAVIHPENTPSLRLAEKMGMSYQRDLIRQEITFWEYLLTSGTSGIG
jgi:RimJ/RimL family protein N-acetyltransferase